MCVRNLPGDGSLLDSEKPWKGMSDKGLRDYFPVYSLAPNRIVE